MDVRRNAMRRRHDRPGVEADIDAVLARVEDLGEGDDALRDELYEALVDLLIEWMVVELTRSADRGEISRPLYAHEMRKLAEQCRAVGLFGPP
jgi:hypothetical protein